MADNERYYGTCRHCKQIRIITDQDLEYIKEVYGEDYEPTQETLDALATSKCECDDAKREQHIEEIKRATNANIGMLFEEDFPDEAELLCRITEYMVAGKISKVSLQLRHNTKATMSKNLQGEIKVQKVVTDKDELLS